MEVKQITIYEAKIHLDSDDATLIDVREPFEYQEMRIPGAILVPLAEVDWAKLPNSADQFIIYCRSGKRSAAACQMLLTSKPKAKVYNMAGGILAWYAAGFATELGKEYTARQ